MVALRPPPLAALASEHLATPCQRLRQYTFDLAGKDLSRIKRVFATTVVAVGEPIPLYLDDVELAAVREGVSARSARRRMGRVVSEFAKCARWQTHSSSSKSFMDNDLQRVRSEFARLPRH
jgi:hypothetical protein